MPKGKGGIDRFASQKKQILALGHDTPVKDIAKLLKVSVPFVYRYLKQNGITPYSHFSRNSQLLEIEYLEKFTTRVLKFLTDSTKVRRYDLKNECMYLLDIIYAKKADKSRKDK